MVWRTTSLGLRPPRRPHHRLGFMWDRTTPGWASPSISVSCFPAPAGDGERGMSDLVNCQNSCCARGEGALTECVAGEGRERARGMREGGGGGPLTNYQHGWPILIVSFDLVEWPGRNRDLATFRFRHRPILSLTLCVRVDAIRDRRNKSHRNMRYLLCRQPHPSFPACSSYEHTRG